MTTKQIANKAVNTMKKTFITLFIVLGMTIGVMAQKNSGGLFSRGYVPDEVYYGEQSEFFQNRQGSLLISIPDHGEDDDQDAPLGSGIAMFAGFGAAYAFLKSKRRK